MADYLEILSIAKANSLLTSLIPQDGKIRLGFSTTIPTPGTFANFTEPPKSTGYERVDLTTLTTPTAKYLYNSKEIHFNEAQIDYSAKLTHWGLFTTSSGGTPFAAGPLVLPEGEEDGLTVEANHITIIRAKCFVFAIDVADFDSIIKSLNT